ncbi:MAG: DNA-directed RNA polymerase subunit alpha C-terminal domain-containing protein, partial [Acidobacteriota bacterium]
EIAMHSRHRKHLSSVRKVGLSNRSRTCLERSQIGTIAELVSYSRSDVRRLIRGAGEKTAQEIEAATHALGLTLAAESLTERELRADRARRRDVGVCAIGAFASDLPYVPKAMPTSAAGRAGSR